MKLNLVRGSFSQGTRALTVPALLAGFMALGVHAGCEGDSGTNANTNTSGGSSNETGGDSGNGSDTGGSDSSTGASSNSEGGTNASSGGDSNGNAGNPSSAGSDGSGAVGGSSGGDTSSSGGAGGGSGELDEFSTYCEHFPETVTLGETIQPEVTGAVLCVNSDDDECRLTTNTYSDGTNPCSYEDSLVFFGFDSDEDLGYARLPSDWEWTAVSAGAINGSFAYVIEDLPTATEITATATAPDDSTYELVFQFAANGSFTITSFEET
jgi:hypothetical protein